MLTLQSSLLLLVLGVLCYSQYSDRSRSLEALHLLAGCRFCLRPIDRCGCKSSVREVFRFLISRRSLLTLQSCLMLPMWAYTHTPVAGGSRFRQLVLFGIASRRWRGVADDVASGRACVKRSPDLLSPIVCVRRRPEVSATAACACAVVCRMAASGTAVSLPAADQLLKPIASVAVDSKSRGMWPTHWLGSISLFKQNADSSFLYKKV